MTQVISDNGIEIRDQLFTGSLHATMIHADGRPYHTFRTPTVIINGANVTCIQCTFENTAGPGKEKGQAIALTLDGEFTGETWAVAEKESGEYLGECRLMLPDAAARRAEIATAPAAVSAAVSLPEKWPPPRGSLKSSHLMLAV